MAVTFISDTKQAISNSSTVTVAAPSGVVDGDTLVLILGHGYYWNKMTALSGWSYLGQGGYNSTINIFTKRAIASETSWTFTFEGVFSGAAWCAAYRDGWVQMAQAKPTTVYQLVCPTYTSATMSGLRLDVMLTRRDVATACVHNNPAWTFRRAYIDGSTASRHIELSVGELTSIGYTPSPDSTWSMVNPASSASYLHIHAVVWLVSAAQPAEIVLDAVPVDVSATQGWVYKGRDRSIDDTPEVP